MELDHKDKLILEEIKKNPGQAARYYSDKIWMIHHALTRGGTEYRLDKLQAEGFISVERIHQRLTAITITDKAAAVLAGA